MTETDASALRQLLEATYSFFSQSTPNPAGVAMWFRVLSRYPLETVRAAFDAHMGDPERGRFAPKPADIIAQIEGRAANDGRPGPEEAWATALRARDEAATVIWTDEASEAFGICRPVLLAGDEVGARMAFKETYERLVRDARAAGRPVNRWVSRGHNHAEAGQTIRQAVAQGLLPHSELDALPAPENDALLLAAPAGQDSRDQWLAVIRAMSAVYRRMDDAPRGPSAADVARADLQRRKAQAQEAVAHYLINGSDDGARWEMA